MLFFGPQPRATASGFVAVGRDLDLILTSARKGQLLLVVIETHASPALIDEDWTIAVCFPLRLGCR